MKPCRLSGEDIKDAARKCPHCQSYQDPADAPKPSTDIASLVISFVGIVATVGTIGAGVFGYLGFRTIQDVSQLSQKVADNINRSNTMLADFSKKDVALESEAAEARSNLNEVTLEQAYDRFQAVFDSIELDYAYASDPQIQRMQAIAKTVAALTPTPSDSEKHLYEMKIVADVVGKYRDALQGDDEDGFLAIIDSVGGMSDESLSKDRILLACYSHLNDIARRAGNRSAADAYYRSEKHYSLLAMQAAQRLNRAASIAAMNYASTLIDSDDTNDMKRGYELLTKAQKDTPNSAISYNIATYFAKTGDLENAMANLEEAKNRGDFATCEDLHQWNIDGDFDKLRLSTDAKIVARKQKLLDLGGIHC